MTPIKTMDGWYDLDTHQRMTDEEYKASKEEKPKKRKSGEQAQ